MNLLKNRGTYLALVAVLLVTFVFRIPTLVEPPWYDDEGIYAAVAHAMLRGATLYRDIIDNRPPGIYWLYAIMLSVSGYSLFFVKLMASVAMLLSQVTVFHIGWRVWGARTGLLAAAFLGLVGSVPLMEGTTANSEIFMMLPSALGILLLLQGRHYLAGIAFAAAFLIKQISGVEMVAGLVALALFHPQPRRSMLQLIAGFLTPVGLTSMYLAMQGTLGDFLFAGFGYYLGYVQREARIPSGFIVLKVALVAGAVAAVWWFAQRERGQERFGRALLLIWPAFALFGALFTSRPYPHYLLQALPPMALLLMHTFFSNWNRPLAQMTHGKLATITGLSVATCWLFLAIYMPLPNWANPQRSWYYYENFVYYATGQRDRQAYNDFFDKRVNRNMALLRFLRQNADKTDSLLIWGEEPWLYALSGLGTAAPYVVSYYAYEMPGGLQRTVDAMRQQKPDYVLWTSNKPLYPELKAELDQNYHVVSNSDNAVVYERTDQSLSLAAAFRG